MRIITTGALEQFYTQGRNVRRSSWPQGDYMLSDGAEGGTLWYYDAEKDELTNQYRLGFHELAADDWEFMPSLDANEPKKLTAQQVYDIMFTGPNDLVNYHHNVGDIVNAGANVAAFVITHAFTACQKAGSNHTIDYISRDFLNQMLIMVAKWFEDHSKPDDAPVN